MNVVYVALGGAIGSTARYLVGLALSRHSASLQPLATFTVNVLGCFVFGVLVGLAERHFVMTPGRRAFLLVGLLGGFTTFSSYTFESFELLRTSRAALAVANTVGQVVFGFVALWAGLAVARAV